MSDDIEKILEIIEKMRKDAYHASNAVTVLDELVEKIKEL